MTHHFGTSCVLVKSAFTFPMTQHFFSQINASGKFLPLFPGDGIRMFLTTPLMMMTTTVETTQMPNDKKITWALEICEAVKNE